MMTKPVVCNRIVEKRKKWAIFEELNDTNETFDEAICILHNLRVLITQLPDKLTCSAEQADTLEESVMLLDSSLDKCMESTGVHFVEIETKLDEMQKSLLHDETCNMHSFSKLASEVRCSQKLIDTLISNAEEEIYRFLESEGLYEERRKTDVRIMELVLNF
ncbi:hypothetical protein AVEN_83708-1 [Araneus ventricosus]|uniref:Uncharacterized protein n=1 Tax=Araneus ventricosus TaxID=182803 RepID=A0A4Y2QAC9_ARAVE|nr:hypothetical protein AVEN_83708-1 [Araneus ventricosus]